MFIFYKLFVNYIFLYKFGPKIWSFPNWLKFRAVVHRYMIITVLMFVFQTFVIHIILDKFGPKI